MSHRLYEETRSILDADNPNARWENNQEGFPAPDLGLGPDGKERDQFTERDVEILASNPITLVAIDAYVRDIISLYQVMYIGYKPLPRQPSESTLFAGSQAEYPGHFFPPGSFDTGAPNLQKVPAHWDYNGI